VSERKTTHPRLYLLPATRILSYQRLHTNVLIEETTRHPRRSLHVPSESFAEFLLSLIE